MGEAIGKIGDINAEPCLRGGDSRYDPSCETSHYTHYNRLRAAFGFHAHWAILSNPDSCSAKLISAKLMDWPLSAEEEQSGGLREVGQGRKPLNEAGAVDPATRGLACWSGADPARACLAPPALNKSERSPGRGIVWTGYMNIPFRRP